MKLDRPRSATLLAVCVGAGQEAEWAGRLGRTAIDKRTVGAPVEVTRLGLVGDEQADLEHHGGVDQALYAYAQQDADHWMEALNRDLPPGSFGENLRVDGLDVTGARIGERWRIGRDVEVQVTAPRIPCKVFSNFLDVPDLIARFLSAGRPGAYLRVVATGDVRAGDRITVLERPDHDVTVADVLRIHTRDQHEAGRLLALDALAERARAWAQTSTDARESSRS
jgi:MOSC domain-containing protein YiiM